MKIKWLSRLAVMAAVGISTLMLATPVSAMWAWCEVDPHIVIDGHPVALDAMVGGDNITSQDIKGNTWFRVYVPRGVDAYVVSTESKVKVKIFENKNLVLQDGVVPFDVVLSVNVPKANYIVSLTVAVGTGAPDTISGTTAKELVGHYSLP